jgi:hypothetical protein
MRCNPAALAEKVDALFLALEAEKVSPQLLADLLRACPGLLRRSPEAVRERYQVRSTHCEL